MTDLISRQDAIALLEGLLCNGEEYYNDGYDRALDEAIKALTNMPSAETPDRCETGTEARDLLRYKP